MKKMLLIVMIASIIFSRCKREELAPSIDFSGGWYVDHIIDESNGMNYPNLLPADSIIIYFPNDSVYYGRTHKNVYWGTYKYNGDSLVTFTWPFFYLYAEDSLGTKFLDLLRACSPGFFCPGQGVSSVITLINGNMLVIKNPSKYKGFLKKI